MAGVDHAYQYSVEVKSRFSLFLDDALNNEDPDLLISKLQTERTERHKKDKVHVPETADTAKADVPVTEQTVNVQPPKNVRAAKPVPIPVIPTAEDNVPPAPNKSPSGDYAPTFSRGRGGPRGFGPRFRGRGQGPRPTVNDEGADSSVDFNQRDVPFEPRGRGRGRARGGFTRGRGSAYTDYREYDRQPNTERMEPRRPYRRDAPEENTAVATHPEVGEVGTAEVDASPDHVDEVTEETPAEGEVEEEIKSYTLEEYKALRSNIKTSLSLNAKETRKPNDGKDVFKNMVVHKKINEISDDEIEEIEREPEESQSFEIDVSFTDRRNDRGRGRGFARGGFERGRGGFERGRGGFRGEGRPRGARGMRGGESRGRGFGRGIVTDQHAAPPVIYSDQDFPTLK